MMAVLEVSPREFRRDDSSTSLLHAVALPFHFIRRAGLLTLESEMMSLCVNDLVGPPPIQGPVNRD